MGGRANNTLRKAAVLVSFLASCGSEPEPQPVPEPVRVELPEIEDVGGCIDRYFDSDLSHDQYFGRIGRDKMSREMRKGVEGLFSGMDEETSGAYVEFFTKARFSDGDLMFPNAADVISGDTFTDEESRRLAGRRMAKSMRPARFPNAYALLHGMPKTTVALVDRVNRPRSGMDVEHAEDIAGFFRALIGFQNRMGEKQRVCDFAPNMSRGQLNELDSYYSG